MASFHAGVMGSGDRRRTVEEAVGVAAPVWPTFSGEVLRFDADDATKRTMATTRVARMDAVVGNGMFVLGETGREPVLDTILGRGMLRMDGNSRMASSTSAIPQLFLNSKSARTLVAVTYFGSAMPAAETPLFGNHNSGDDLRQYVLNVDANHNPGMPWLYVNGPSGERYETYGYFDVPPPTSRTSAIIAVQDVSGGVQVYIDNRAVVLGGDPAVGLNNPAPGNIFSIGAWRRNGAISYANQVWIGAAFVYNKALTTDERATFVSAKNSIYAGG